MLNKCRLQTIVITLNHHTDNAVVIVFNFYYKTLNFGNLNPTKSFWHPQIWKVFVRDWVPFRDVSEYWWPVTFRICWGFKICGYCSYASVAEWVWQNINKRMSMHSANCIQLRNKRHTKIKGFTNRVCKSSCVHSVNVTGCTWRGQFCNQSIFPRTICNKGDQNWPSTLKDAQGGSELIRTLCGCNKRSTFTFRKQKPNLRKQSPTRCMARSTDPKTSGPPTNTKTLNVQSSVSHHLVAVSQHGAYDAVPWQSAYAVLPHASRKQWLVQHRLRRVHHHLVRFRFGVGGRSDIFAAGAVARVAAVSPVDFEAGHPRTRRKDVSLKLSTAKHNVQARYKMCYIMADTETKGNWWTVWGLTALAAQMGFIVPLMSMLQLKKWN